MKNSIVLNQIKNCIYMVVASVNYHLFDCIINRIPTLLLFNKRKDKINQKTKNRNVFYDRQLNLFYF